MDVYIIQILIMKVGRLIIQRETNNINEIIVKIKIHKYRKINYSRNTLMMFIMRLLFNIRGRYAI